MEVNVHNFFRAAAPLLVAGSLLGACATPAPTERLPQMTFAHLPVFEVDVAKVEIENRFKAPLAPPHIEHKMPTAPARALEQWLTDRVKAVGRTGTLRMIIEDARSTETELAKETGLKGALTKQQGWRYDMAVKATLELKGVAGDLLAQTEANAERSITAREDISLNDREKLWFDTLGQLMASFDKAMDANVRHYMGRWLR